jgi:hypothetical protein
LIGWEVECGATGPPAGVDRRSRRRPGNVEMDKDISLVSIGLFGDYKDGSASIDLETN